MNPSDQALTQDNNGRIAYQSIIGSRLGPIAPSNLPHCGIGSEFIGTVTPRDYRGMVLFQRVLLEERIYADQGLLISKTNQPDNSHPPVIDADPQSGGSGGKVYDLDAPGLNLTDDTGLPHRWRMNFRQFAVLPSRPGSSEQNRVVSPDFLWFSRGACRRISGQHQFAPGSDIRNGPGTTNITWNLQ